MAAKTSLNKFLSPASLSCCTHLRCVLNVDYPASLDRSTKKYLATASARSTLNQQSFGPSVRLLLTLYDIKSDAVAATGPHGHLLKGDVLSYISSKRLEPKPLQAITAQQPLVSPATVKDLTRFSPSFDLSPQPIQQILYEDGEAYRDIDLSSMRKTIAKRITISKTTIPHVYASTDCKMNKLYSTRRQLSEDGIKVSVNDIIVKSCAAALMRMPEMNCIWGDGEIQPLSQVDVAVAVATDSGLTTPIITSANEKSVAEISCDIRELAGRARENKLRHHEIVGGSMTVSNLGMFGVKEFKAVVNPPQACILAVGNAQLKPNEDRSLDTYMNITLSCDGRIVDDIQASRFIELVKDLIENPVGIGL